MDGLSYQIRSVITNRAVGIANQLARVVGSLYKAIQGRVAQVGAESVCRRMYISQTVWFQLYTPRNPVVIPLSVGDVAVVGLELPDSKHDRSLGKSLGNVDGLGGLVGPAAGANVGHLGALPAAGELQSTGTNNDDLCQSHSANTQRMVKDFSRF